MQDLRVVLVQADQLWEDKEGNFRNYNRLFGDIEGVDLIVLPEMFHTGFSMNPSVLAETMDDSSGLIWLKMKAKEKNCALYTSLIISDKGNYYNRGVFVYPTGEVSTYDKRKCFGLAGEDKVFTAGQKQAIVEFRGWKIQLQICYDLRFPEISRNKINSNLSPNYDVLVYVANWPEKRRIHWQTLLTARAIENQSYVIGVNRV
jgi:predicted amidohydrolase